MVSYYQIILYIFTMKKLIIIRKVFKELFPELKVIVRYNKDKHFEIIIKNVNIAYVDPHTHKVMLRIPGKDALIMEDFINGLFGYCPIINEDNCVIKYLDGKGGRNLTKPTNY
jgi:hypothetical protein